MFNPPPYLVSYTAPGFPLEFETPRPQDASWFWYVNGGGQVQHWREFSNLDDAYSMLWHARLIAPNSEIYDVLRAPWLPPDVGRYPVPIMSYMSQPSDTTSVYVIVGDIPLQNGATARLYQYAGAMADFKAGLYNPLTAQYQNLTGTQNLDALYGYISPEFPVEAEVYWGDSSTGPALGGLPY